MFPAKLGRASLKPGSSCGRPRMFRDVAVSIDLDLVLNPD